MRSSVLVVVLPIFFIAVSASAIVNPHYDEGTCGSCHLRLPVKGPDGEMDYSFLGEDIDSTCLICHEKECCTIAKPHEMTHPSGIDEWDEEKYGRPDTLPLSGGYITCATCHYWRRDNNPSDRDYKLLRLVDIGPSKIEWTVLCRDCHKGYD